MLDVTWRSDGRGGHIREDGDLLGLIGLVSDWHEPGSFEARTAWVIDWMAEGIEFMQRSLVELDGEPLTDHDAIAALSEKAKAVVEAGPPSTPLAFGAAATGLTTNAELRELIEVTIFAVDDAGARVMRAAESTRDDAAMPLCIAIAETVSWLRGLDELLAHVWSQVSEADREAISAKVDQHLDRPQVIPGLISTEREERGRTGKPYQDWAIALLSRGVLVEREELQAFRWVAGKLLHHGPLSAIELQQWRGGEPPRWKWRTADAMFPPTLNEKQTQAQRSAYDKRLAGRDVIGTLNLITMLIEAEYLFLPLLP